MSPKIPYVPGKEPNMSNCTCGVDDYEIEYMVDGKRLTWDELKRLPRAPRSVIADRPPIHAPDCPEAQIKHNIFEDKDI